MSKLPFWFPKKNNFIWYILFILLFLLSLDLWGWNKDKPMIFGIPIWVYYLIILTFLTSIGFFVFTKLYWSEE